MVRIISIISFILLSSHVLAAQSFKWSDLVESRTYKIDRNIELTKNKANFSIVKGDKLKLLNFKPLPMINVFMAELKAPNCSDASMTTEMILVDVEQGNGTVASVGVDLAENCILEIFIDKVDYNAYSMFQ